MSQDSRVVPAQMMEEYKRELKAWETGESFVPPSCSRIGNRWGVSGETVRKLLKDRGIEVKQRNHRGRKSAQVSKRKLAKAIDGRKRKR